MLFIILWIIVAISLISICLLTFYYVHNMPLNPQPELHRNYPLNVHGWIVYLTRYEKLLMNCLSGVLFISIILAVMCFFFMHGRKFLYSGDCIKKLWKWGK
jgi:hypothetical protein